MIALMTLQQSNERPLWGNLQFLAIGMRWLAQLQHPSALPVDSIMLQEGVQCFTGDTVKSAIGLPFEISTYEGKHASPSSFLDLS